MPPHQTSLGAYLRVRRDLASPAVAGVRSTEGRRVPGLRRDEVADLAGISADYYLKLEQGRVPPPSDQVLVALARALGLGPLAVDHMRRLAGGPREEPTSGHPGLGVLERIIAQWPATPAYVIDRHFDVVAASRGVVALSGGELAPGRNALVAAFAPAARARLRTWEEVARAGVAALRFDGDPTAPRFAEVVDALAVDADFARLWALHEVGRPSDFDLTADLGDGQVLEARVQNLLVPGWPGCRVTLYHAAPGSPSAALFARLADGAPVA